MTLPPATPAVGWEHATSFIECCWLCQSRIVACRTIKATVKPGTHDIGLCRDCERGFLP